MEFIFVLVTQLINRTIFNVGFQVVGIRVRRRFLPELPPGTTRFAKQSRILGQKRQLEPGTVWKIRVLLDGRFTGIELDPQIVLDYVRVVFRVEKNGAGLDVLCVDGVRENRCSDFLFRLRYFGFKRDRSWDRRLVESIDRSDTSVATKLRNLEDCHCQYLAPFVDATVQKSAYPDEEERMGPNLKNKKSKVESRDRRTAGENGNYHKTLQPNADHEQTRPRKRSGEQPTASMPNAAARDDESPTNGIEKDSFVNGILFLFALMLVIFLKFLLI